MNTERSAYEYFTAAVAGRAKCLHYLGRSFSGDETIERIDAVASFLRGKVGKGDVVAINLPNTPECIFTIYAVNKLGAIAYVTHPLLPPEALRQGIVETGAKLLVCRDSLGEDVGVPKVLADGLGYLPAPKRTLARFFKRGTRAAGTAFPYDSRLSDGIPPIGGADDVALYLPSGGTTGVPKTICVTNRAFNANAEATLSLAKMDLVGHGVLLALPFFHGFGLSSSLHGAVSGGAEGIILPYLDYKRAGKYVLRGFADIILAVPNMYRKLLSEPHFRKGIGKMTLAFSGGDTLPAALKREYDDLAESAGSASRLYQGYGLAETVSVCVANSRGEDRLGSIGRPVNADVRILDEEGIPLADGEVGEIAVKTPCMMKGYLGQGDFTEEYLKTGDLGYRDADGYLYFSGRKKRILVIGGMNVYPLEIESVACEVDFVSNAAAEGYLEDGKPKIALFVAEDSGLSEEKKRQILSSRLASRLIRYAMPSRYIFLRSLPVTPIGKVDHDALARRLERK